MATGGRKMEPFYKPDGREINPDFIGKQAEYDAKQISDVTPTQMRRLFNHVKSISQSIDEKGWEKVEPLVRLQKAQLLYTIKRGQKNAKGQSKRSWENLKEIIPPKLDQIKTAQDYKVFSLYMEALYGFYYAYTN